jgi:hypothetical protein
MTIAGGCGIVFPAPVNKALVAEIDVNLISQTE